jgi:hypothetical protein
MDFDQSLKFHGKGMILEQILEIGIVVEMMEVSLRIEYEKFEGMRQVKKSLCGSPV